MNLKKYIAAGVAPILAVGTASAWTPGTYPAPSRDLTVDRQSRNDVLAFWHGVYQASEGFQSRMNWSGSYATSAGAEGTTSAAFIGDMERRLNYFRAMSGIPANAAMNSGSTVLIEGGDTFVAPASTTKDAAAQRAALMMAMSYDPTTKQNPAFSHNPPVSSVWDAVPWNANHKGNIALNINGPDAITAYMREESLNGLGAENSVAGHRRWLTRASSTDFATGDVPAFLDPLVGDSSRRQAANVIYVLQKPGESATVPPVFTSYPSSGFFPAPLNTRFWSLTYPGANFNTAKVNIAQVGGSAVTATIRSTNFGAADPTIVWEVPTAHAATSFPQDRSYSVTVSGISGTGIPTSHSYQITLVNPDKLTSDQSLSGTGVPHPATPATYTFTPPPLAEALRVNTYREIPVSWTETAEAGTASSIIDRTSGTYTFLSSTTFPTSPPIRPITGLRSFRLTHATSQSPADQIFELGRQILPNASATITFKYRRGYMATSSKLAIESSADDGVSWSQIGSTISGISDSTVNDSVLNGSAPILASTSPVLIRFRYYATPGLIYTHDQSSNEPTGILIDTITLDNTDWLEPRKTNDLVGSATSFVLDTNTQGSPMVVGEQWNLALQTKLGNRWFPDGPLKSIVPSSTPPLTPYEIWETENPGLTGGFGDDHDGDGLPNGIEYAFFTDPKSGTIDITQVTLPPGGPDVSIQRPLPTVRQGFTYAAECSESLSGDWSSQSVVVTISGGTLKASAPRPSSGKCFLRWKVVLP
jgi:hypothetical protein